MNNLVLKLCSLLASICLVVFVNYFFAPSDSVTSVVQVIAPVEIQNVPESKTVYATSTNKIELTIQGSSLFLSKVALNPPIIKISPPDGGANKFVAKISPDSMNLPSSVRLIALKPAEVEVTLDSLQSKKVPIIVPRIGNLVSDLQLDSVTIAPETIQIRGPSRMLSSLSQVESAPLDLSKIVDSVKLKQDLRIPQPGVEVESGYAEVSVAVSFAKGEVSFSGVPIRLQIQDETLQQREPKLEPALVVVTLSGTKKRLRELERSMVDASVLLESESQLGSNQEVSVAAIEGVTDTKVTPRKVQVVAKVGKKHSPESGVNRKK